MTLSGAVSTRARAGLQPLMLVLALGVPQADAQVVKGPANGRLSREPEPPVSSPIGQGTSPALIGALAGGGAGVGAGLLFAHEACNEDPCGTGAYVLTAVGGAALLGAMGALISSQAHAPHGARRSAWTGAAVGAAVGAVAGIVLVAASCENESCGPAGYASVAMVGAGVLGAVGAVLGSRLGAGSQEFRLGDATAIPILGPSSTGILVGARIRP
jgi:hypothetical protein